MKTKIIPFDLETAKKIQAGEIEGRIKTKYGEDVRIVCWDRRDSYTGPILALYTTNKEYETPLYCNVNGKDAFTGKDIVLEVPDNEPQFKPFDKVLVRRPDDYYGTVNNKWVPAYYQLTIKENGIFGERKHLASGILWKDILPFYGHEHLVGTTDKPKEN